jgi:hypothetical protein
MATNPDSALRKQLIEMLRGGHAHATFEAAVKDFPVEKAGTRPQGLPYSAWELLEHLRIAQEDILRFSQTADHASPKWPEGYWPANPAPASPGEWQKSVRAFEKDLAEFQALVEDPGQDLYRAFPWGDGQTLLREAMLIVDHNAYHIGQLVLVRRLVGAWPE